MQGSRAVRLLRRGIDVVWWLTWAVAALFIVLLPAYGLVRGEAVSTPFTDPQVWAEPASGAAGLATRGWGEAQLYGVEAYVEFTSYPGWFVLASLAGWSVVLGLLLCFLFHLRGLAGRVVAGAAFDADNVRRLKLLAWTLAGMEVAEGVVVWWQSHVVIRLIGSPSLEFGRAYDVDPGVLLAALVLYVLAEIFRRGTLLEEDQALTV